MAGLQSRVDALGINHIIEQVFSPRKASKSRLPFATQHEDPVSCKLYEDSNESSSSSGSSFSDVSTSADETSSNQGSTKSHFRAGDGLTSSTKGGPGADEGLVTAWIEDIDQLDNVSHGSLQMQFEKMMEDDEPSSPLSLASGDGGSLSPARSALLSKVRRRTHKKSSSLMKRSMSNLAALFQSEQTGTMDEPITESSGWNSSSVSKSITSNGSGWTVSGAGSSAPGGGYSMSRMGSNEGGGNAPGGGAGGNGGQGPNGHRPSGSSSVSTVQSLFRRLELVGRGAYGAVYRGVHLATGTAVALKVVNLDTPEDDVQDIQHEVALLSQMKDASKHNVVRYWGCWLKGPELWIVMDFAEGGSVRTLMKSGPIPERLSAVIVRETLVALSYLHKQSIIHRDIKAANILLTDNGKIMLCDFGIAANLQMQNKRSTMIGTPYWMAPEVISKGKLYDQSADIWSLGITIFEMVTGNPPLADLDQLKVISLIPNQTPPRLPADGTYSPLMRDFVASCLNEVARERPTADELSKSKWMKAHAKVPNSALKELLQQYTSWVKGGGMRTSLLGAGLAGLGEAGNRDSFAFDGRESDGGWEFNTARSGMFTSAADVDETDEEPGSQIPAQLRGHPLMRLFDQDDNTDAYGGFLGRAGPGFGGPQIDLSQAAVAPAPVEPNGLAADAPTLRSSVTATSYDTAKASLGKSSLPAPTPTKPPPVDASKSGFSGTGNQPFRFGGGGNTSQLKRLPAVNTSLSTAAAAAVGDETMRAPSSRPSTDSRESPYRSESSSPWTRSAASSREDVSLAGSIANNSSTTSLPSHFREASKSSHVRGKSSFSSFSSSSQSPMADQNGFEQRHESKSSLSRLMRFAAGRRGEGSRNGASPLARSQSEQPKADRVPAVAPAPKFPTTASSYDDGDGQEVLVKRLRTGSAPETPPVETVVDDDDADEKKQGKFEAAQDSDAQVATSILAAHAHNRMQHGGSDPTYRSSTDAAGQLARMWRERSPSQTALGAQPSQSAQQQEVGGQATGIMRGASGMPGINSSPGPFVRRNGRQGGYAAGTGASVPRELALVESNLDTTREGYERSGALARSGATAWKRSGSFSTATGTTNPSGGGGGVTQSSAASSTMMTPSSSSSARSAASTSTAFSTSRTTRGRMTREASESAVSGMKSSTTQGSGGTMMVHSTSSPFRAASSSQHQQAHTRTGATLAQLIGEDGNVLTSPLDLVQLQGKEEVNAELGRRVDEVAKWLEVLGYELGGMLSE